MAAYCPPLLPAWFQKRRDTQMLSWLLFRLSNNNGHRDAEYPPPKESTLRNSLTSDKNRKVHKTCARYREIPDIKFRRELGFGPIVNWFDPAPVLSAMMLLLYQFIPSATKTSPQLCSPSGLFLLGFGRV